MWTVVYIAPNQEVATGLKQFLAKEGILAVTRPVGIQLIGESCGFEVLVPESEAEEALILVSTILHKPSG